MSATRNRPYSPAQAQAILRLAEKRQEASRGRAVSTDDTALSAGELIETGRELGLSPEHVQAALVQFDEEDELAREQGELRQLAYRGVAGHLTVFSIVQALLWVTGVWAGGPQWLLVLTVVWAGLLLLQLRAALFPHPDGLRKRAKARILTKRLKASGRDFSEALQSGAAKLLATSAKKIDAGVEKLTQGRDKS